MPVRSAKRVLVLLAQLGDARHVDFVNRGDVRRSAARLHHVLRNLLAHHGHLLDAIAFGRFQRRGCGSIDWRQSRRRPAAGCVPRSGAGLPDSMKLRMSFLVTRPLRPVPSSLAISTPCSWAILRTSGLDFVRRSSSAVAVALRPLPSSLMHCGLAQLVRAALCRRLGSSRRFVGRSRLGARLAAAAVCWTSAPVAAAASACGWCGAGVGFRSCGCALALRRFGFRSGVFSCRWRGFVAPRQPRRHPAPRRPCLLQPCRLP